MHCTDPPARQDFMTFTTDPASNASIIKRSRHDTKAKPDMVGILLFHLIDFNIAVNNT